VVQSIVRTSDLLHELLVELAADPGHQSGYFANAGVVVLPQTAT
jgi:hypothetical protein